MQGGASAASGCGGEDCPVECEDGDGGSPGGEGLGEGLDDVGAGDGGSGRAGQQEPGVVVDDVEDFGGRSVGEAGDVGLGQEFGETATP